MGMASRARASSSRATISGSFQKQDTAPCQTTPVLLKTHQKETLQKETLQKETLLKVMVRPACRSRKRLPPSSTFWTHVPATWRPFAIASVRRNCRRSWRSTNQSSRGPTSRLATSRPVWRHVPGHYETQAVRLETSLGYHLASDCHMHPRNTESPSRRERATFLIACHYQYTKIDPRSSTGTVMLE
jgi:hypothetical protein